MLRIWRIEATDSVKTVYTTEELASLVAESRIEGLLDPEEHARIAGALALHDRTAADAVLPWAQVTTVGDDVSPAALEVLASRTGRSRFPVVDRAVRGGYSGSCTSRTCSAWSDRHGGHRSRPR